MSELKAIFTDITMTYQKLAQYQAGFEILCARHGYRISNNYDTYSVWPLQGAYRLPAKKPNEYRKHDPHFQSDSWVECVWWVAQQPPIDDGREAFGKEQTE